MTQEVNLNEKSLSVNEAPKVSVVVLAYNHEKSIARALDSILSQKIDFPYEIIIGDDASTDRTEEICRDYEKRYPHIIRYVRNERNKGVIDNYYDCLLMARGDYIADLAGDDFWINNEKIKKQVEILDAQDNVSLVCTDWTYFNEASQTYESPWADGLYPYQHLFNLKGEQLTKSLFIKRNPVAIHLCSALYRKRDFIKLYQENPYPFRNKEFLIEDLQLIILLSSLGEYRYLDSCTLAYSRHPESITGTTDFKKVFDVSYGSLKLNRYLVDRLGFSHMDLNEKYQRMIHYVLMQAFHAHDKERLAKVRKLIKDWKFNPSNKTKIILALTENDKLWGLSRFLWSKMNKKN